MSDDGQLTDLGHTAGLAGLDFHYQMNLLIWSDSIQKAVSFFEFESSFQFED